MQHQFSTVSFSGDPEHRIRFVIRDNWLDGSAPMFEIEARAKSIRDESSTKLFVERAVIDVNKSSIMVEQGHGGASAHMVSTHREDREIQRELATRVSHWVDEVADLLEMALEGSPQFFENEMRDLITRLESHLQFKQGTGSLEEGLRDRRDLVVLQAKMKAILLRMSCSSMMFLVRQQRVTKACGDQLLHDAERVFVGLAKLHGGDDGEDDIYNMANQAAGILERHRKGELDAS